MDNLPFLHNDDFNSPFLNNGGFNSSFLNNDGFNSPLLYTNDASNSPLLYTNDASNSHLLQTNNSYNSPLLRISNGFTDNIMTSEDILDDFNEQPVLQNALADFENERLNLEDTFEDSNKENELDFEEETEDAEPKYSLTVNQIFET
ncbi:hypothetical protein F8M41_023095 [Gigaspora margarita]|uniref:Uncharacterized protein n=1 Tax=Gigaspora margarita TaxID=4874 RepID=A0A8H4AE04_GIGMA|nr:hypothetical protein F8M41_023095 [Gigaspora margarita]